MARSPEVSGSNAQCSEREYLVPVRVAMLLQSHERALLWLVAVSSASLSDANEKTALPVAKASKWISFALRKYEEVCTDGDENYFCVWHVRPETTVV